VVQDGVLLADAARDAGVPLRRSVCCAKSSACQTVVNWATMSVSLVLMADRAVAVWWLSVTEVVVLLAAAVATPAMV